MPKIIYTHTDEAPALATYSFLPILQAFAKAGTTTDGVALFSTEKVIRGIVGGCLGTARAPVPAATLARSLTPAMDSAILWAPGEGE